MDRRKVKKDFLASVRGYSKNALANDLKGLSPEMARVNEGMDAAVDAAALPPMPGSSDLDATNSKLNASSNAAVDAAALPDVNALKHKYGGAGGAEAAPAFDVSDVQGPSKEELELLLSGL
jgi:hypothetical protein